MNIEQTTVMSVFQVHLGWPVALLNFLISEFSVHLLGTGQNFSFISSLAPSHQVLQTLVHISSPPSQGYFYTYNTPSFGTTPGSPTAQAPYQGCSRVGLRGKYVPVNILCGNSNSNRWKCDESKIILYRMEMGPLVTILYKTKTHGLLLMDITHCGWKKRTSTVCRLTT